MSSPHTSGSLYSYVALIPASTIFSHLEDRQHNETTYLWLSSPTAWTKAPVAADTLTETPRTGMKERWRSPGGGESWLRHAVRQRVHHSACKNVSIFYSYNLSVLLEHVKREGDIFSPCGRLSLKLSWGTRHIRNFREKAGNVDDGES